jgi:3',5'-cyclic AMP phosphodiesterase CpdA
VPTRRVAEYPRPDHVLFHFSDTHLIVGGEQQRRSDRVDARPLRSSAAVAHKLYGEVDAEARLRELLDRAAAPGIEPTAIVFTGDLADAGQRDAYAALRSLVEPFARALDAPVIWVMGNHDDRATLRATLRGQSPGTDPMDEVHLVDGLRIVVLDTTVPGHHHGELSDDQLRWLADVLAEPAPFGTILAMHHPPVPCVLDPAVSVELRDQRRLARVLAGTDVRSILAGHLHFSTAATFAGIPVSVASSTCYSQDLTVAQGGIRGRDAAQSFNYVHLYPDTVVHSVVPLDAGPTVGRPQTPQEAAATLADEGIVIPASSRIPYVMQRQQPARRPGEGR